MIYLESIEIVEDHRTFKKGERFNFESVNLLVGDQGCGKSTILEGLQLQKKFIKLNLTEECQKQSVETFFFDTEKMNPRVVDPLKYTNFDGSNKGIGFGNAVNSRWTSHGETLKEFTVNALKKASKCVIFLDEPESALSLKNQYLLVNEIKEAIERKCQIFLSTHSLVLIQSFPQVLSIEHKKWMKSEDFISFNVP